MYTQYTIFDIKRKIDLNYLISAAMFFFQGLKYELATAVVNEPSVFEPLKFCCSIYIKSVQILSEIRRY